jgi:hypothetical protein
LDSLLSHTITEFILKVFKANFLPINLLVVLSLETPMHYTQWASYLETILKPRFRYVHCLKCQNLYFLSNTTRLNNFLECFKDDSSCLEIKMYQHGFHLKRQKTLVLLTFHWFIRFIVGRVNSHLVMHLLEKINYYSMQRLAAIVITLFTKASTITSFVLSQFILLQILLMNQANQPQFLFLDLPTSVFI